MEITVRVPRLGLVLTLESRMCIMRISGAHAGIVADQTIIRRVSNVFTVGLDSFLPVDSLSLAYGVMFVAQGDKPPKAKRESLVHSVQSPVGGCPSVPCRVSNHVQRRTCADRV